MQSTEDHLSRRPGLLDAKIFSKLPDGGLVLMDISLRPIAVDRGASTILNNRGGGIGSKTQLSLPKELMDMIGNRRPDELVSARMTFQIGSSDYRCRAYLLEGNSAFPPMIALHINKISTNDPISAVVAKFNLTEREHETLRGISMGLSSKELASRMNISPNTVKVFLRLIMIKMGVSSRGAIISQILQHQSARDDKEVRTTAGAGV